MCVTVKVYIQYVVHVVCIAIKAGLFSEGSEYEQHI